MCRIAGIINAQENQKTKYKLVKAMCDVMAPGGPDDEGFENLPEADYVLGHRRLALLDLSPAGHQPMYHEDLTIVFNGEIYNFQQLREQLQSHGHTFQTRTDTEVILKGFEHWGTKLFNLLEGMFAFVIHSKSKAKSYLVRDEYGIKPLYFHQQNQSLIFASEVKAFHVPSLNIKENQNWKALFLSFGHIPHPYTTLQDVYSLNPGYYMEWNHQTASSQVFKFKTERPKIEITDKLQAEELIQQKLEAAVENHLLADAPVGVFLSGGIDSSLLTLLADKKIGSNLRTVSINFAEQAYSEGKYQEIVANQTKGTHSSYTITEFDLTKHLPEILAAMDQPSNDAINSWFVNKCAKENGLKAVLSGIGADELFGGYPSFQRIKLIKYFKKLPRSFWKLFSKLPDERWKRFYFLSLKNPIGEYLFLRGFYTPDKVAALLNCSTSEIVNILENYTGLPDLYPAYNGNRAADMESHLFMRNQLLKDTDFMSMRHGIEVRVPFLDKQLGESLNQIAPELKFNTGKPKGLLVNSFLNLLPEEIWNRPKMGFTFPLQIWLQKNEQITNPSLYQHNPVAKQIMNDFKAGKIHWSRAYSLFQVFNK